MNVILLGPPGVGKGTLASIAQERLGLVQISTGGMLRRHLRLGDELGMIAKAYIDDGELVPDSVIIDMVKERLREEDTQGGYILDGFPRTLYQAEELAKFADIDLIIDLELEHEAIIRRLSGRRACLSCNGTFHISMLQDETTCPTCGHRLEQRKDDLPETIAHRLEVYEEQTAPLIELYRKKGNLVVVEVDGTVEENYQKMLKVIEENQ